MERTEKHSGVLGGRGSPPTVSHLPSCPSLTSPTTRPLQRGGGVSLCFLLAIPRPALTLAVIFKENPPHPPHPTPSPEVRGRGKGCVFWLSQRKQVCRALGTQTPGNGRGHWLFKAGSGRGAPPLSGCPLQAQWHLGWVGSVRAEPAPPAFSEKFVPRFAWRTHGGVGCTRCLGSKVIRIELEGHELQLALSESQPPPPPAATSGAAPRPGIPTHGESLLS